MNSHDMMPPCTRIAAVDPVMADRMWNTVTADDGTDRVDERMRQKGRTLCEACPMRLDCIGRALVGGWKDKAVYGGLDYMSRWSLARLIGDDLGVGVMGLHRLRQWQIRDWLAAHPDWDSRMRSNGTGYWRQAKRRQRAATHAPTSGRSEHRPDCRMTVRRIEPMPTGPVIQGVLF